MSLALVCALALLAAGDEEKQPVPEAGVPEVAVRAAQEDAAANPRGITVLLKDVRAALKEATATAKSDPDGTADRLIPLYIEVRQHPVLNEVDRTHYAGVLRLRLKKLGDRIAARIERDPRRDIAAQVAAGPAVGGNGNGGAGGQAPEDRGQELVELIQTVISPETWDVNGGLGSIYYYAPLRVLVVRQTSEVQGRVGGLVEQVR